MKMKKTLYTLLFASLPILATAQEAAAPLSLSVTEETAPESTPTLRFAWFSQEEVLRSMPEYQAAGRYVDSLKTEYAREAKRSADDFSLKYEEFLDQQRNLATSIRRKRQAELQELMSRILPSRPKASDCWHVRPCEPMLQLNASCWPLWQRLPASEATPLSSIVTATTSPMPIVHKAMRLRSYSSRS